MALNGILPVKNRLSPHEPGRKSSGLLGAICALVTNRKPMTLLLLVTYRQAFS